MSQKIHIDIDNSYDTINTQVSAIKMRLDADNNITNSDYYKEHDLHTYNVKPWLETDLNVALFDSASQNHLKDQVSQNYIRYSQQDISKKLSESEKLQRSRRTDVEKARISVKQASNDYKVYKYFVRVVIVSFVFLAIIGSLYLSISAYELEKPNTMYIYTAMGTVGIIYSLIFYLYYRETWRRQGDDWNKLVFSPPK